MRYFLDTCIWRDFYEHRLGRGGKALGSYASRLFAKLLKDKSTVLFTDIILKELGRDYDEDMVIDMLNVLFVTGILKKAPISARQYSEARILAKKKRVPVNDALNAIIARDNRSVLISQDNHFYRLQDTVEFRKPEELI